MVEKFLCVCRKGACELKNFIFLIIGLRMTGTAVAGCWVRQTRCSAAAALFNARPALEATALVSTQAADRLPALFQEVCIWRRVH
ncbi:hypothetical protein ATY77_10360 [Rhizobium sp. R634]|nr:hypothetical protein ATY77_10360 [Rhizobium sp. R634]